MEVQALGFGPFALVGAPFEAFTGIGLALRRRFAPKQALLMGYTNGLLGYIADRESFAADSYAVGNAFKWYLQPGPMAREAGDVLLERAVHVAQAVL